MDKIMCPRKAIGAIPQNKRQAIKSAIFSRLNLIKTNYRFMNNYSLAQLCEPVNDLIKRYSGYKNINPITISPIASQYTILFKGIDLIGFLIGALYSQSTVNKLHNEQLYAYNPDYNRLRHANIQDVKQYLQECLNELKHK